MAVIIINIIIMARIIYIPPQEVLYGYSEQTQECWNITITGGRVFATNDTLLWLERPDGEALDARQLGFKWYDDTSEGYVNNGDVFMIPDPEHEFDHYTFRLTKTNVVLLSLQLNEY